MCIVTPNFTIVQSLMLIDLMHEHAFHLKENVMVNEVWKSYTTGTITEYF